eukprot:COSAG01_NODE_9104_length_2553_cov_2.009780_4_plen_136_part_00
MPRPQWTGTACAADMLEINCLMETLGMLCGCPTMMKPEFKPSAAVCGPSTGCGKALTGVTPTCAAKMDKDPSSPGLKILKAACGHGPAPPPRSETLPSRWVSGSRGMRRHKGRSQTEGMLGCSHEEASGRVPGVL